MPATASVADVAVLQPQPDPDVEVLSDALRRLSANPPGRNDSANAFDLCRRAYDAATAIGDSRLAAEARTCLALIQLRLGDWEDARSGLEAALELSAGFNSLSGQIEQHLGAMANAEGEPDVALGHYERSLALYTAAADGAAQAMVFNELGRLNADVERWDRADECFRTSFAIADAMDDDGHRGHALLNRTEVHLATADYDKARMSVEQALQIFDSMGQREFKAAAYKSLGVIFRDTGQLELAESRLSSSLDFAAAAGATLIQADASRELALLYKMMGRHPDTLKLLTSAHRLFGRLDPRRDLVDVGSKTSQLEGLYLGIVHDWGASIESSDTYTHGHSERVAEYAVRVATTLGLHEAELTTIRVGAYLHDLGKLRVPHEVLNKTGALTKDEVDMIRMHPLHGVDMLATVDFPWDIKPIIRSHHERLDGSGYPDRLRGDEIPLYAQIVGIVDIFDALTSTRTYRRALPAGQAISILLQNPQHFRSDVLCAFLETAGLSCQEGTLPRVA
jgi:putative nucleotidyltransferase with HDIG domain